jgi:hypothetical protein
MAEYNWSLKYSELAMFASSADFNDWSSEVYRLMISPHFFLRTATALYRRHSYGMLGDLH